MESTTLLKFEIILHWLALFLYIGAALCFIWGVIFKNEKSFSAATVVFLAGLLPHTLALLVRWYYVYHGPYLSKYEVLSSNAWVTVVMFLFFSHRYPKIRFSGMFVAPFAFFQVAAALFASAAIKRFPSSFKIPWLVAHILFNKLAVGAFLIAIALMIAYALKSRGSRMQSLAKLPDNEVLDEYIYKFTAFGFCFWTITIAAGAIWAHESWGRYWGWDPVEIWSLITWLLLGSYLHLRLFFGWKGRNGMAVLTVCYVVSILTVFFLPFLVNSLHSEYFK
jgi:cytochrome c-type biogenesis protein CcsB